MTVIARAGLGPRIAAHKVCLRHLNRQSQAMLAVVKCAHWDVGIIIASDTEVCDLNQTYRGLNRVTDVLSFPFHEHVPEPGVMREVVGPTGHDEERNLGDIVLAWDYVVNQAVEDGVSAELRTTRLIAHGLCHLVGYVISDCNYINPLQELRCDACFLPVYNDASSGAMSRSLRQLLYGQHKANTKSAPASAVRVTYLLRANHFHMHGVHAYVSICPPRTCSTPT